MSLLILTDSEAARFWSRVDRSNANGCWLWTGKKSPRGYGVMKLRGRMVRVNRLSFEMHAGPLDPGMGALHRCDVPSCVNPSHLWAGTADDNNKDRDAKGRARFACGEKHGSHTMPHRRTFGERNGLRIHPEKAPKGERNGQAKVTAEMVLEMRRRFAAGVRQFVLVKETGLNAASISMIIRGINWSHLPGAIPLRKRRMRA